MAKKRKIWFATSISDELLEENLPRDEQDRKWTESCLRQINYLTDEIHDLENIPDLEITGTYLSDGATYYISVEIPAGRRDIEYGTEDTPGLRDRYAGWFTCDINELRILKNRPNNCLNSIDLDKRRNELVAELEEIKGKTTAQHT